jgi:flagellar hook-associated protein 1 FlgK
VPDILSTGGSALLAFQRMLATTSHNVANASTPGYSRQRALLGTRGGQDIGPGFIGAGVQVNRIERTLDGFIASRLRDSASELGRLTELSGLATRIDRVLSDRASGIAVPMSDFLDAAQSLSAQPASAAARSDFLGKAEVLAARFRTLDGQLDAMVDESSRRADGLVAEVNTDVRELARLNNEIVRALAVGSNAPPNDLLDQRDLVLQRLSGRIGVTAVEQDGGALNVFTTTGQALVVGTTVSTLAATRDPYDPSRRELSLSTPSGPVLLGSNGLGGELGGLLEFARTVLDPAQERLGRLAAAFVETANAQHREGVDFYGDLGGDLFAATPPTVAARNGNAGGATFATAIDDVAALDGEPIELTFDGAAWSATTVRTGRVLTMTGSGTGADPFVVGGVSLVLSGTPTANDAFLLRPTTAAGGGLDVLVTDPNRLAAALPVRASAAVGNLGSARIGPPEVLDATDPNLRAPVDIVFVDANNYTIGGTGPFPYVEGAPISYNGWQVSIQGPAVAGDTFRIDATPPRSSDNGNARALAGIGRIGLFDGGSTSMVDDIAGMTSQVGSAARRADLGREAQSTIQAQIEAERESVSGVNLDEEAANLVRFQQAYQAAAQIITVADTVFQSLLSAMRR